MLSNIFDRICFWALFLTIALLPVFVLPYLKIPVEAGKGLVFVLGLSVSIISWAMARFFDGKVVLPKSWLLASGFFLVFIFFLSAFFSSASQASFFGLMLDVGSFWFILAACLLMLFSAIIFKDPKDAKIALLGTLASSSLALLFQVFHLLAPAVLSLGIMPGKVDNLLGSWNALGILAGFAGIISLFLIEFFSMPKRLKRILAALIVLSIIFVALVNFLFIWLLLGISALIIFVYRVSFFHKRDNKESAAGFPAFSFAIVMVSLLFFVSGNFIGSYLPGRLGISNTEVRPSLSATISVMKSGLRQDPVLGLGPNRFADAWAMHKPGTINLTPFWNTVFDSGSGTLPTVFATTGYAGLLAFLLFLLSYIFSGVRSFFAGLKNGANYEVTTFLIASFYLLAASFFYAAGPVILLLAFAFVGIFAGLSLSGQPKNEISISFLNDPRKSFFCIALLVLIMLSGAALSFKYIERLVSVPYFSRALSAESVPAAEANIVKALDLSSNDLYLRAYSQIQLINLGSLISRGGAITDAEKAELQHVFDRAVQGALLAAGYDKDNYLNFRMLGFVYESVAPLGVEAAYDKAFEAYLQASRLSPLNPSLKLDLARVAFNQKNTEGAGNYIREALSLKPDYTDAVNMLSEIQRTEIRTENITPAAEIE